MSGLPEDSELRQLINDELLHGISVATDKAVTSVLEGGTSAVLTRGDIEAAIKEMRDGEARRWEQEAARAVRLGEWLGTLPEHARNHVLIQTIASSRQPPILHPADSDDLRRHIDAIVAMTPEEAEADSKACAAAMFKAIDNPRYVWPQ
jgi:hypothetical protein